MNNFQKAIASAVQNGMEDEIVNEFQIAKSVIPRWISGVARPHPTLERLILEFIRSRK